MKRTTLLKTSTLSLGLGLVALTIWGSKPTVAGSQAAETRPLPAPAANEQWIQGSEDEKMALIAKHLRGMDMAMVEAGYRYSELYWAGKDRNWEHAAYQLTKIRLTLELGMERRPKRAASTKAFFNTVMQPLNEAITQKNAVLFDQLFVAFTSSCNSCHAAEKVPFMQVKPPQHRVSPIHFSAE